jgi:hypothetical protein
MLLETERTIALKNNNGGYDVSVISVFNAARSKSKSGQNINLKVRCPLCGGTHAYKYSLHEFCTKTLIVGGCEFTGMPLFYLGDNQRVHEKINRINRIDKKICAYI